MGRSSRWVAERSDSKKSTRRRLRSRIRMYISTRPWFTRLFRPRSCSAFNVVPLRRVLLLSTRSVVLTEEPKNVPRIAKRSVRGLGMTRFFVGGRGAPEYLSRSAGGGSRWAKAGTAQVVRIATARTSPLPDRNAKYTLPLVPRWGGR